MLYDLFFIGIIALTLVVGFRKGAAKSLLSLGVFLASLVLAIFLARPLALLIYDAFFKSSLESKISEFVVQSPAGAIAFEAAAFLATLPKMLFQMLSTWGRTEHLTSGFASYADSADAATTQIADMIAPVIIAIISGIVCILLFIVLRLVLGLVGKGLVKVFRLPLLRFSDSLLGGVIGLLKGVIIVFAIVVLLNLLYPFLYESLDFVYTGLGDSVIASFMDECGVFEIVDGFIYGI